MKKLLTLTVLFAFMFGGIAFATDTRVLTMGDANGIVKDEANVFIYPSTINSYPKLFVGEYNDGSEFSRMGAHFQFQEESSPMVIGAYFRTDQILWPDILWFNSIYDYPSWDLEHDGSPLENRRITLMFGKKLGEIPFGMAIDYDNAKEKYDYENWTPERSFTRLGITLGISPMEGKLDLAGSVSFMTWTDKGYYGEEVDLTELTKPSGNMKIDLNARYWTDPMGKWILVPHLGFTYEKQGYEELVDVATYDKTTWSIMNIDLGLGTNYQASEDVMAVTDIGFNLYSLKDKYEADGADAVEDKYSELWLPYFRIGVDAKIFNWLDFRGGVKSMWISAKETYDDGDKDVYGFVQTDTYLGAGFNWNKLEIDAQIDPEFLQHGPNFISGARTRNLNTQVSLIYWFE